MFVCLRGKCHKRRRAMSWEAARDKRQILQQKKIWQSCNILSLDRDDWECEKTTLCDLGSFLFLAFFSINVSSSAKWKWKYYEEKIEFFYWKSWAWEKLTVCTLYSMNHFSFCWLEFVDSDFTYVSQKSHTTQYPIGSSFVNFINLLFCKQKF